MDQDQVDTIRCRMTARLPTDDPRINERDCLDTEEELAAYERERLWLEKMDAADDVVRARLKAQKERIR